MAGEKRLFLNIGSGLVCQIIAILCGLILPRLMLSTYGSNVNGLIYSVMQCLNFITLFEMGMASVISASLYKPLADKNYIQISKIHKSSQIFFNKIGLIFAGYVVLIAVGYSLFIPTEFSFNYVFFLVLILSISMFAQYFFGISYLIILRADQLQYIDNVFKVITLLLSTLLSIILIDLGFGIHILKFVTAMIFLIHPILVKLYVDKLYHIERHVKLDEEPIKQKWNGFTQHIAFYITSCTDMIVLTLFSSLSNVSVYSIYAMVINSVTGILEVMASSLTPYFGNFLAKEDREMMKQRFGYIEWALHQGSTLIYTATAILIVPFVRIYTTGIDDANYIVPVFGVMLTIAYALRVLRIPYNSLVLAAGHFKETQISSMIEAGINIVVSVIGVCLFGLVGVAFGTVLAMLYRTGYLVFYLSKNILHRKLIFFLKNIFTDLMICTLSVIATSFLDAFCGDYYKWIIYAVEVLLIIIAFSLLINVIFNGKLIARHIIRKRESDTKGESL